MRYVHLDHTLSPCRKISRRVLIVKTIELTVFRCLRRRQIAWDPTDIFYSPPLWRLVYFILAWRACALFSTPSFVWRKIRKWKEAEKNNITDIHFLIESALGFCLMRILEIYPIYSSHLGKNIFIVKMLIFFLLRWEIFNER